MSLGLVAPSQPLYLAALEVCSPLGLCAEVSCAEALAGALPFMETDVEITPDDGVRAARLSLVLASAARAERMAALAATALSAHLEWISGAEAGQLGPVPVFLALPEASAAAGDDEGAALRRVIERTRAALRPELDLQISDDSFCRMGRAGFFAALADAARRVCAERCRAALVGAVDSLCDPATLRQLAAQGRALGPGNRDGVIPGEGAGFLLLLSSSSAGLIAGGQELQLVAVSLAEEPHPFAQSAEPNLGEGLTLAFRRLRTHESAGARRPRHVLSCQTGESFWADEFSLACLRNASLMPEPLTVDLVASRFGDAGAATGVIQLAMAARHVRRLTEGESFSGTLTPAADAAAVDATRVLVYGCSDSGLVGACIVEGTTGPRAGRRGAPEKPRDSVPRLTLPSLAQARGARGFRDRACEVHLSELGFLLAHRRVYLSSPDLAWTDASDLELRLSRHLAALRAWGAGALAFICESGLASDDPDVLAGAVLAVASLGDPQEHWSLLIRSLSGAGEDGLDAWELGLRMAAAGGIGQRLGPLLSSTRTEMQALAARVMAYRREGDAEALRAALVPSGPIAPRVREAVCTALAQLGDRSAQPLLEKLLRSDPGEMAAISALCALGHRGALEHLRRRLGDTPSAPSEMWELLAIVGSEADAQRLMRAAPPGPDGQARLCTAMGICGAPELIAALVERLRQESEPVRLAASLALERMTAAGLRESVPVVDPDEDGDSEAAVSTSRSESVVRPSTDPAAWLAWCRAHQSVLRAGPRVRLGRPFSLEACIDEAEAVTSCYEHRALAMRELAMRRGVPLACEADSYVEQQRAVLRRARADIRTAAKRRP